MTTPREITKKIARLKRSKLGNPFRHANGLYRVRAKVNGKSVGQQRTREVLQLQRAGALETGVSDAVVLGGALACMRPQPLPWRGNPAMRRFPNSK